MTAIKVVIRILKAIFILIAATVTFLGILGGGWGAKKIPEHHEFYSGDLHLISHRGVTDQAPENTVAAARRAEQLGFRSLEFDLKQSKDQQFYAFHDRKSDRLLGTQIDLKDLSLAELQQYPLQFEGKPSEHRIPTLDSLIITFRDKFQFYVDVKRHGNYQYNELASRIVDFMERYHVTDNCFIGSDFLFTVYLEYRYPQLHTVFTGPGDWTIMFYKWLPKKFRPDFMISYAKEVTEWHLGWLKKKGLMSRRMLYGVNGDNYAQVRQWGVPILVVDYDPAMDKDLIYSK